MYSDQFKICAFKFNNFIDFKTMFFFHVISQLEKVDDITKLLIFDLCLKVMCLNLFINAFYTCLIYKL